MALARIPDDRRTITASEAQRYLGIPAATIRGWAAKNYLLSCSIGQDGQRWYLLAEVLEVADKRARRRTHKRPNRRSLRVGAGHITSTN